MTAERKIFLLWLEAAEKMDKANGEAFTYRTAECTAYTESMAAIRGCTFIEASRHLMNLRIEEARA